MHGPATDSFWMYEERQIYLKAKLIRRMKIGLEDLQNSVNSAAYSIES